MIVCCPFYGLYMFTRPINNFSRLNHFNLKLILNLVILLFFYSFFFCNFLLCSSACYLAISHHYFLLFLQKLCYIDFLCFVSTITHRYIFVYTIVKIYQRLNCCELTYKLLKLCVRVCKMLRIDSTRKTCWIQVHQMMTSKKIIEHVIFFFFQLIVQFENN